VAKVGMSNQNCTISLMAAVHSCINNNNNNNAIVLEDAVASIIMVEDPVMEVAASLKDHCTSRPHRIASWRMTTIFTVVRT
jgi:hypothetical protein